MQVRCDACGTLYEVEPGSIPAEGGVLYCTDCGHSIRVTPASETRPTSEPSATVYSLRKPGGEVYRCDGLARLQRWVVEFKVERHDEVSTDGSNWRQAGGMDELSIFFELAARPGGDREALFQEGSRREASRRPTQSIIVDAGYLHAAREAEDVGSERPFTMGRNEAEARGGRSPAEEPHDMFAGAKVSVPLLSGPHRGVALAGLAAAAIVIALLAVKILMPAWADRLLAAAGIGTVDQRAVELVEKAVADQRLFSQANLAVAEKNLVAALAIEPEYPRGLAVRAINFVLLAEHEQLLFEQLTRLLSLLKEERQFMSDSSGQQALQERMLELTRQAERSGAAQSRYLELAREALRPLPPEEQDHQDVLVARAALMRISGKELSARELLGRLDGPRAGTAEALFERGLLELGSGGGGPTKAAGLVEQAMALDPANNRYLLRLAELRYVIGGPQAEIVPLLDRVLAAVPGQRAAQSLRELLDERAVIEQLKQDRASAEEAVAKPDQTQPAATPDPAAGAAPRASVCANYDSCMDAGYRQLERGRTRDALDLFQAAARFGPGRAEPHTAIGYAQIDLDRHEQAARSFQRSLELNPRFSDAVFGLAEVNNFRNNSQDALKYYRQYVDLAPGGQYAAIARRNIQNLSR